MSCREEVLAAARTLSTRSEDGSFTPADVIRVMQQRGTRYAKSTIRTHVVSRMCVDAPEHHGVVYADLQRIGPGRYRLTR
jgi:hypothetical protein